ncbi:MAG TPA: lytic transglycosylase domain-containing protein [Longimicrobiales bacterium]
MTDERRTPSTHSDDEQPLDKATTARKPAQQARGGFRRVTGRKAVAAGLAATSFGALAGASVNTTPGSPLAGPDADGEGAGPQVAETFSTTQDWDIEVTKNEQVDFFIEFLQGKNYDKTRLWLERLGHYGPMIQQKLAERDMPQDLIWLAMIESGLDPNAYSSADAAGLWQFIEETGERYGLEVSKYVDERRNPEKATDAALTYLQELHDRFGSWYLAAASYNTGENRVERVLNERAGGQKGNEQAFWKIAGHLPRETRDYVPVMLAMGHIGKNPEQYGFTDLQMQEPMQYDTVTVPAGTRLEKVAAAVGVDADTIYDLNPELIQQMTPPDREWEVRLPEGSSDTFSANWGAGSAAEKPV